MRFRNKLQRNTLKLDVPTIFIRRDPLGLDADPDLIGTKRYFRTIHAFLYLLYQVLLEALFALSLNALGRQL